VRIFFVLSGFLITHLLLLEEEAHGRIHLGSFYQRRAFRILPVYAAFVLVFGVLNLTTALGATWKQYLSTLTFTKNMGGGGWHDGHLWSLAVEQQFYLLWPLTLILLRPRWRLAGAGLMIGLAPCLRVAFYVNHNTTWYLFSLPANMDALMFGGVGALALHSFPQKMIRLTRWKPVGLRFVALAAIILVWQIVARLQFAQFTVPFGATIQAAAAAFLVASYSLETDGPVFRILNSAPLRALGILSYSLYIWQQLFFVRDGEYAEHHPFFLHFPWNLGAVLIAAILSFYGVERPFFRVRGKLRQTAESPDATRDDQPLAALIDPSSPTDHKL
jgi:peptidoglycan/LPS O-acetylase OafA/YrhL